MSHRLRGSAGSHGFAEVGEQAGASEDAITALTAGGPTAPIDAGETLDSAVRLLELLVKSTVVGVLGRP